MRIGIPEKAALQVEQKLRAASQSWEAVTDNTQRQIRDIGEWVDDQVGAVNDNAKTIASEVRERVRAARTANAESAAQPLSQRVASVAQAVSNAQAFNAERGYDLLRATFSGKQERSGDSFNLTGFVYENGPRVLLSYENGELGIAYGDFDPAQIEPTPTRPLNELEQSTLRGNLSQFTSTPVIEKILGAIEPTRWVPWVVI